MKSLNIGKHLSLESYLEEYPHPFNNSEQMTVQQQEEAAKLLKHLKNYFFKLHTHQLPRTEENHLSALNKLDKKLNSQRLIVIEKIERSIYFHDEKILTVKFRSKKSWQEIDRIIPPYFEGFGVLRHRMEQK